MGTHPEMLRNNYSYTVNSEETLVRILGHQEWNMRELYEFDPRKRPKKSYTYLGFHVSYL